MANDEAEGHMFSLDAAHPRKGCGDWRTNSARAECQREGRGRLACDGCRARISRKIRHPPPCRHRKAGINQSSSRRAAELAEMIELDLASHPDCPKAGFRVTVYGWPRWRAMLTIKPAAGGIRNPQEWRELTQELAERLRKRYDVAWEE